jgi:hypothetical protein
MRFRLVALLLLLLVLPALGQQNSRSLVPNSPKGFDKQYKSVFRAYEKGNEKELLERFRAFAIPERWFADEFGPEEGPKLSRQYLYRFRDFETDTVQEFNRVICDYDSGCNQGLVKTRAARRSTASTQAPPAPTSLLSLPPVQRFRIEHFSIPEVNRCLSAADVSCTFSPTGQMYDNSWASSFIYLDGAFRFVGYEKCPFWDRCAANHPYPASELNEPPEPVHFNLMQKSQSRDLSGWMAKLLGKNH